jgi:hypothetical protein
MKKKHLYLLTSCVLLCICFACKSPERIISKQMEKSGIHVDKKWIKTLEKGKKDVSSVWLDLFNHDLKSLEKRFYISLTDSDLDKLKYYPVVKYLIDSTSFANITSKTDIKKFLALREGYAKYYILNDDRFIVVADIRYINEKMVTDGDGALPTPVSNTLKDILLNRKLPLFEVDIDPSPALEQPHGLNVFIDEQGNLMYFKIDGVPKPFKEYMVELAETWRKVNAKNK